MVLGHECYENSFLYISDLVTVSRVVNVTLKAGSILLLILASRLAIVQSVKGVFYVLSLFRLLSNQVTLRLKRKLRRDWWKTKLCTACVSPLGRFLSRGGTCPQCGLRVCKNCRSESPSGTWVCVLCSGGMPSDELTKTAKSLGRDSRSIRRSWTISNPQRAETNSPILKSYTVLYPEDGVTTDGSSGGCGSSNDSIGDAVPGFSGSVSTGHLSTLKDVSGGNGRRCAAGSNNGRKSLLGGSDQGISGGVNQRKNSAVNNHGSIGVDNHNADGYEDDDHSVIGMASKATRPYNSLPRMSSSGSGGGLSLFAPSSSKTKKVPSGKRSCNPNVEIESIVKRHRSFQSTLHPYTPATHNPPPSPNTSINFIEETFWDYYDYEFENSSSDPGSTPRNLRKSATAAAISDIAAAKAKRVGLDGNGNTTNISNNKKISQDSTSSTNSKPSGPIVAFRTDSNRSSCERSLGETMDYDCSLRLNYFSSLSDTEINDPSKYDEKDNTAKHNLHPGGHSHHRRNSNEPEKSPRATTHYATISSTKNPYLPASEYVYRRRHDEMLNEAPPKPERKSRTSKRSMSLNAYDGRKLFSPLKTYCVLMKENIEPENKPEKSSNFSNNESSNSPYYSSSSAYQDHGPKNVSSSSTSATPTNSAIWNNNHNNNSSRSPISLSLTTSSSPLKFNSLPRERYIRIEREDGDGSINVEKYSSLKYPSSRKNELLLGKSSTTDYYQNPISSGGVELSPNKGRNVTRVPIVKDDNHVDSFPTQRNNSATNHFTVSPTKAKIERSQSHREISNSRPYPYYHHYHPHQQHQQTQHHSQNSAGIPYQSFRLGTGSADKPATKADLNFMPAGTTTTLPTNFRTNRERGKATSSSLSVWDDGSFKRKESEINGGGGGGPFTGPGNFFHSDFDDGSDVVIENFIKTHSSSGSNGVPNGGANNASNTLPKRKYPPSSTHISHQQRRASDNNDYFFNDSVENIAPTVSHKSDFKEANYQRDHSASDNNYLRQCSTFPRGMSQRRDAAQSPSQVETEQLPNFCKNAAATTTSRNNASKGYPCHDKLDVFFTPTTSVPISSKELENVPKHKNYQSANDSMGGEERILPIKINSLTAGSGFSATLPHPYIRRKTQGVTATVTNGAEKAGGIDIDKRETMQNKSRNSGPSISQVEMDIERDIFYQKTKSLDRVRPSSKSKLKSVLSLGRSNNNSNAASENVSAFSGSNNNLAQQQQHFPPTMEIDYSDSQPYNNSKSRLHEKLLSIDQVDRSYVNGAATRSGEAVGNLNGKSISSSDLLQPQQIHHAAAASSNNGTAAPIPSPRLKRKAKLTQSQNQQPKIIGDELSSPTKLIGPGTNYGSNKKPQFPISSNTRLSTEPDSRERNGVKPNAPSKSSTNPISFGVGSSASNSNESSPSGNKFTLPKETSIKADHPHYPNHPLLTTFISAAGVDGTLKGEKGIAGANHISQPSSGGVTPNFTNSDSPGANFMISAGSSNNNSALSFTPSPIEFELEQQQQSSSSSSPKHFADFKTKAMPSPSSSAESYSPLNNNGTPQQIKSALATNNPASGSNNNTGKAVRFEPHVIAMEIESEQRKLLQQQMNQHSSISGTAAVSASSPAIMNGNSTGINSPPGLDGNTVSGLKSNSGNLMHRHGSPYANKASASGRHHSHHHPQHHHSHPHYVHASSYLPVLYHSYQHHNHKYIRKGANGGSGAGKGAKKKSFVARAIAKVKSKAGSKRKENGGTTNSTPTVYFPVGKNQQQQPQQHSQDSSDIGKGSFVHYTSPAPSVITYISPQPQTQHQQPPVQQSLEESTGDKTEIPAKSGTVPSITVSLTSIEAPSGIIQPVSPGEVETGRKVDKNPKKYQIGKHIKSSSKFPKVPVAGHLPPTSSSRRMDGYFSEQQNGGVPIPDSFLLQSDRITPSSTSSSSSSSFTSNLQESYELFHNQTLLPDNGHNENNEMVDGAPTSTISSANLKKLKDGDHSDDDEEEYDSLNEDEDSDNNNANDAEEDGPHIFKSFEYESDLEEEDEEDDDEEPDFVFYPTPRSSSSKALGSSSLPLSGLARQQSDKNRNKAITSAVTQSSTDVEFNAPFSTAHNNETTTKGNANKGKSPVISSAEPKMVVVGIPTYRSPNSKRLNNSHSHHHQQQHRDQYGKSQFSFPNANPTEANLQLSALSEAKSNENVNKPHPTAGASSNNGVIASQGASFGISKDAPISLQHCQSADVTSLNEIGTKKGLLATLLPSPQLSELQQKHHSDTSSRKTKELDHDDDSSSGCISQQSEPFVPFHLYDKGNGSAKGRQSNNNSAQSRGDENDYACEQSEHERNVDHYADKTKNNEDTLQKDSKSGAAASAHNVADSGTRHNLKDERVYPPDAKGVTKISTSLASSAASTKGNSTGGMVNTPTAEGSSRLSDPTISSTSHGQHCLPQETEEGLCANVTKYLSNSNHGNVFGENGSSSSLLNVKNNNHHLIHHQNQSQEQDGGDSVLQSRTSASGLPLWATRGCSSTNGAGSSAISTDRETLNHNTVTNKSKNNNNSGANGGNENEKDAERLQRLELVKRQQQNILTHINNSSSNSSSSGGGGGSRSQEEQEKGNFKSGQFAKDAFPECFDQPNSLETQCANDQSFLSESEVGSSCGGGSAKSPSPSPRFKPKKFGFRQGGGASGNRSLGKTGESRIPSPLRKPAGEFEENHLLNTQPSQEEGEQSKSENVVKSRSGIAQKQPELQQQQKERETQVARAGMSILPPQPQQHPHTKASASESGNVGKFKSRVLLNSDDLEDDEELSRAIADVATNNSSASGGNGASSKNKVVADRQQTAPGGKKNITTVEISGDVGIVSSNHLLHNVATAGNSNPAISSHKPANAERTSISSRQRVVSSDHLQSSGLSLIQQPNLLDLNSSSEEEEDRESAGEGNPEEKSEIRNKFMRRLRQDPFGFDEVEVGSSVSANESGCDNDTEKTSDDNSSDWQSESTNTVIFRGSSSAATAAQAKTEEDLFYAGPNSYLDPEIQINNITVGGGDDDDADFAYNNEASGSGNVASSSALALAPTSDSSSSGKVNVGYKATKVNKVSTELIIGIKKSSADNASQPPADECAGGSGGVARIGSKRKFDKGNDVSSSSSSSSSAVDSSEELGKSNETLTDIPISSGNQRHDQVAPAQHLEEEDNLQVEMVMHPDKKVVNGSANSRLYVPNSANKSLHHRRESPEGQEQEVPDRTCSEDKNLGEKGAGVKVGSDSQLVVGVVPNAKEKRMEDGGGGDLGGAAGGGGQEHSSVNSKTKKHAKSIPRGTISKEKILQNVLSQIPSRSSPDGADKSDGDATPEPEVESPSPAGLQDSFDVTSDEDSWVEEILFEDDGEDQDTSFDEAVKKMHAPLDLRLHTIVEESCEDESEAENSGNFYQPSTSGLGGSQKNTSLSQSDSNANELERYFNFGIYTDSNSASKNSLPNEESEFSDTFSESSFSLQEDDFEHGGQEGLLDPAELASTRLEKYFYNLGGPQAVMNTLSSTMMTQNADSDSVGSESDSDNSVLEKRKKVLKHHRRSADFEEEFGDKVSDEEDNFVFGQDGFDTIKKTARKTKKSGSEGSIENGNIASVMNQGSTGTLTDKAENEANMAALTGNGKSSSPLEKSDSDSSPKKTNPASSSEKPTIKVNRSNSFTWSSDEEVNIMMSKLRQLIKNLIKSKTDGQVPSGTTQATTDASGNASKDKQLVYLENELIRLMKTDNLKNIVEYLSSEESDVDDVYKFIKVVNSAGSTPVDLDDLGDLGDLDIDDPNLLENLQSTMQLQQDGTMGPGASPKSSPALLAKVMHHIGNRLNMWMKDEGNVDEEKDDDNVTLKCAPSVSSDLNEDRFSWKGSFESALAAKRQSVGSTDSISSSDYGQDKSMLRSSSLHHLTTSQPIEENKEEEEPASSLPRMTNLCNSLPRLNQPNNPAISRAHSLVMTGKNEQQQQQLQQQQQHHHQQPGTETYPTSISGPVKSARYRPPGFLPSMKSKRIDTEEKASPAILSQSTPVLTQDSTSLKSRSDSMGSIVHDVKPVISVKGQVEFGLQYNYKLACLEVKVVGCRDLAAADSKRNRSDPYVKAYLLPDKSKAGKRKTKTKKNTLNPVFDEILKFPLTLSDLQKRTLWLSVWHSDMFGKNEFLGEILVPLRDRVFDDPNPGWWDLQEMSGQMEDMPKGDVVIALKWTPKTDSTGNLSVLVKEAKNLVPVKNGSPSTFVKCALLSEKTRKQKTSICRRNFNPVWNQTLLFEDVDDEGVEITIWNHDLLASHDLIGTVRLEYDNPLWESMLSRPSFWVEGGLKLS